MGKGANDALFHQRVSSLVFEMIGENGSAPFIPATENDSNWKRSKYLPKLIQDTNRWAYVKFFERKEEGNQNKSAIVSSPIKNEGGIMTFFLSTVGLNFLEFFQIFWLQALYVYSNCEDSNGGILVKDKVCLTFHHHCTS